ncbi:phosphoenolpyruvate synthase [Candidatus Poribacteria bacterium]|nr:MAG: phosphoenolpyruvate synthase [Candidatus Poribacteria bacterium]
MSVTANPDIGEEELITIANFSHPTEADPVVAWLESEGIECFVTNEHTVTMNWLYSNAIGGVGVQVKAADVERANEILQAVLNPNAVGDEPTPTDSEMDQEGDATSEIRCPECGSENVYYEKFSRRLVFASWVILTVPLPFFRKKWKCQECAHLFK